MHQPSKETEKFVLGTGQRANDAGMEGVPTLLWKEEFLKYTGHISKYAIMKDATTKSRKEEFVIGMEEGHKHEKHAITKDAPTNPIKEDFV